MQIAAGDFDTGRRNDEQKESFRAFAEYPIVHSHDTDGGRSLACGDSKTLVVDGGEVGGCCRLPIGAGADAKTDLIVGGCRDGFSACLCGDDCGKAEDELDSFALRYRSWGCQSQVDYACVPVIDSAGGGCVHAKHGTAWVGEGQGESLGTFASDIVFQGGDADGEFGFTGGESERLVGDGSVVGAFGGGICAIRSVIGGVGGEADCHARRM